MASCTSTGCAGSRRSPTSPSGTSTGSASVNKPSESTSGGASAAPPRYPPPGSRGPDWSAGSGFVSPAAGPRAGALGDAPVLAVVGDLFFVARIRETGRLAGVTVEFARTPAEVEAALARGPRFVLVDLTAGYDYERMLRTAEV